MKQSSALKRRAGVYLFASLVFGFASLSLAADDCQPTIVLSGAANDTNAPQLAHHIQSVSIQEQSGPNGEERIVFRIKVASLEAVPPQSHWQVDFKFGDEATRQPRSVQMISSTGSAAAGAVHFLFTGPDGQRNAASESNYTPDGTITIAVAKEQLRAGLAAGQQLIEIAASTYTNAGALPDVSHDAIGGDATYIVNGTCQLETPPLRLANISGRSLVQQNENVGIGGFIISGVGGKRVIVRGSGPSLKADKSPLPGRLSDPTLELRAGSGELIAENDNWRLSPDAEQIRNSGLAPTDDKEPAVIATLESGAYTAVLRGANQTQGIAVVEIYDLQAGSQSELANLAARTFVRTGDDVLVGGFILTGGNSTGILLRAIGPSLAGSVPNELQDPTMELFNPEGLKVAENNDWRKAPNAAQIEATGAAPTHDREAAILMGLSAGNYTAIVRGVSNGTGVGVVEIYRLQ